MKAFSTIRNRALPTITANVPVLGYAIVRLVFVTVLTDLSEQAANGCNVQAIQTNAAVTAYVKT
eukprot:gene24852-31241_t